MNKNALIGKSVLIVEQGFLREEAFEFLNAQGINADFLKIEPHKPFVKNKIHKLLNVFNRLVLKKNDYLEEAAFQDKNRQFLNQIYNKINKKYDYILFIRHDNFNENFVKYICKYGSSVYGYLWDSVNDVKENKLSKTRHFFNKVYCFDEDSIHKYPNLKMNYATNFFYPIQEVQDQITPLKNHVFSYVGQLANRRDITIDNIISKVNPNIDISYNINIVVPPDFDKKQLVKNPNFKYLEHGISLHDYLFITAKSSIVLDIQIIYQKGFTFRIFEATHYKKKIITTNPKVKELEFYHPDNILIFTENTSSEEITNFLTKPYHLIDENLINKYRLDHWLENRLISHQNG